MANILYSDTDFPQQGILVEESLYETLYRLQEAHWGLRDHKDSEFASAINWLHTRMIHTSPRLQWHPTDYDRERTGGYRKPSGEYVVLIGYPKLPTGEAAVNPPLALAHIFLSATGGGDADQQRVSDMHLVRDAHLVSDAHLVRDNLLDVYPGPRKRRPELLSAGYFCCPSCTAQYQLALSQASPTLYRDQEPHFMRNFQASRSERRRWYRYPFYYTLLALHEIGSDAAQEELHTVAQGIRPSLLKRYQGGDRQSRFRRLALETALDYG
jgi:hypothetical protein